MTHAATFRLFAQRLKAASDKVFYEKLHDSFTPKQVNSLAFPDCVVFDGNLEAITDLMKEKGWEEDGRESERYTCMTKGKESVRLDMDPDNTQVTLRTAPLNPERVNARITYADPSDLLTDPQIGDEAILPENELSIGDSRPVKMTNNGQLPSIPVSGGGAGGGGYGGVAPSPNPEPTESPKDKIRRMHNAADAERPRKKLTIQEKLARLRERRGEDENGNPIMNEEEFGMLEEPGEPAGNQMAPESMSDSPIFMADQPWGYSPNTPLRKEDLLDIQEIDPEENKDSDITMTDVPIGSPEGSRPMPIGDKYMAKASMRIRAAKKG